MSHRFVDEEHELAIEDRSGRLHELLAPGAQFERIASGLGFTEGPVWRGDQLLFSDIPNDRICRWRELPEGPELTTFRAGSGSTNGLTLDRDGNVLACAHTARAVLRFDANAQPDPIAAYFEGRRLNSPNDLVVRRNGDIYFTDPPYGIDPDAREQPVNGVYRLSPDGSISLATDRFVRPNGLAFSPDESVLYIGDSGGPRDVWAFDVAPGRIAREPAAVRGYGRAPGAKQSGRHEVRRGGPALEHGSGGRLGRRARRRRAGSDRHAGPASESGLGRPRVEHAVRDGANLRLSH